jgi:hypothetical protein
MKLMEEKPDFVYQFSNGRATSTKELTTQEATDLIKHLSKYDPCDKMRKKVFALAYEAGIIWGDTLEDKKMNAAKLNMFLRERGTIKKDLSKMKSEELVKVVSQFQQMIKHNEFAKAGKATKNMLAELSIPIGKRANK